tara:strand:- start:860 stop:1339 length:480 start_codon:yes stop_codon:yes gene_type:complete
MAAKYLIFSIFFSLVFCFNYTYAKTLYGNAKVIDGDTIHLGYNKIRLHAIDAPEKKQQCTRGGKKWNCGLESTKFLRDLIGNNQIQCETNGRDKYNRYIGVCYKNNIDLNGAMVLNGWAIAYRYYSLDYVSEENTAKSKKVGIWIGEFEEPYLFRKKNK